MTYARLMDRFSTSDVPAFVPIAPETQQHARFRESCQLGLGVPPTAPHCALQVWFPSNYTLVSGQFAGTTAFDTFTYLLANFPTVVFTSSSFPSLNASGIQVHTQCTP
jgi:hypothetical protein